MSRVPYLAYSGKNSLTQLLFSVLNVSMTITFSFSQAGAGSNCVSPMSVEPLPDQINTNKKDKSTKTGRKFLCDDPDNRKEKTYDSILPGGISRRRLVESPSNGLIQPCEL